MIDYCSNIPGPDLRPRFLHARPMDRHGNPARHLVLCDPEMNPACGYVSRDEGAILWDLARRSAVPGPAWWLEIGSHTGWSTAHISAGLAGSPGSSIVALDPEYEAASHNLTGDPAAFAARAKENLEACDPSRRVDVSLIGATSYEYIAPVADPGLPAGYVEHLRTLRDVRATGEYGNPVTRFSGVFIDGEHEAPFPAADARMVLPHLTPDACVVLHDLCGRPVLDAVGVLVDAGFRWRPYRTPQLMAVCWRGRFEPPDHCPDPAFDWDRWEWSLKLDFSRMPRS